jgi:hypothetical protein
MMSSEKIRLINKQLAQDTKELHRLIISQTPLAKRKVTLSALYDNGNDPVHVVGSGEDGTVFKIDMDGKEMAVKIIDKCPALDFPATRAFIAKDQAYREFKALKLIGTHPNFFQLYSTELDEFKVTTEAADHHGEKTRISHDAWAIRMSYEQNLTKITDAKALFGFDHTSQCVDARCASAVFMHILSQMAASLRTLRSLGIRHRDLDNCNVKLKVPDMTLKIFDFSRADFTLDDTMKSPNEMMQTSYELPVEDMPQELPVEDMPQELPVEDMPQQVLQIVRKIKRKLLRMAYRVPDTLNPKCYIRDEDEPSDFEALRMRVENDLTLSSLIHDRLEKTHTSDYDKYDNRIRHFLLGRWLTVEDLPQIDPKDYNEYLKKAITLYASVMNEHETLEDAVDYLKTVPRLTLQCNLADTSDPVNADWLSDDLPSVINALMKIGGASADKEATYLHHITSLIDADGDSKRETNAYIQNVVDPFMERSAHGFSSSSEDIPKLRLFYKLKRVVDRMSGYDSCECDHFDQSAPWDD